MVWIWTRKCPGSLSSLLAVALVLASPAAWASSWEALQQPGAIAVMRHALAPGTGDPRDFDLMDCSTQRNLDETGRAQARATGQAFRVNGIEVDRVLSSQWCRCRETAELLNLAEVEAFPPLNSFFADRSTRDIQTQSTRDFLARLPDGKPVVLVTHQVNISALTGRSTSSGEIIVIEVAADGSVDVLGDISPLR